MQNAPPVSAPAESDTKNIVILSNVSFLKYKNSTAVQTHKLMEKSPE